jgi:hypothetical protein
MKPSRRLVDFLLGAVLAAVLTILVGRGRDGDFAPVVPLSPAEKALERPLEHVRIDHVPFERVVAELGKQAGIAVVCDETALSQFNGSAMPPAFSSSSAVSFAADQIALADALQEAIRQVSERADVECAPEGDRVVITSRFSLRDRSFLNVYDIRDLLRQSETPDEKWATRYQPANPWPMAISSIGNTSPFEMGLLITLVAPDSWSSSETRAEQVSGRLVVLQTWEVHREIRRLLKQLRQGPGRPWPQSQTASNLRVWSDTLRRYVAITSAVGDEALRRRLDHIDIQNRPLSEALASLAEQAHASLEVDWPSFKTEGFEPARVVSFKADGVMLATALTRVLQYSDTDHSVGFRADDATIRISKAEDALTTRVYDIRGFVGSPFTIDSQEKSDALIRLLTETAVPDSWRDNGGSLGMIRIIGSKLVITQSWQNLEIVERLLSDLMANPLKPPQAAER